MLGSPGVMVRSPILSRDASHQPKMGIGKTKARDQSCALFRAAGLGRSQFSTFATKYPKGSAVLRACDAEHKLDLPVASDAANYVRFKRGALKGHEWVVSRCAGFRQPSCLFASSQPHS